MKPVVFVGDKPSIKNVSEKIPFVGASCSSRLSEFIAFVQPDLYFLVNAYTIHGLLTEELLTYTDCEEHFCFIALGNEASIALDNLSVPHIKLPHPSGLNRKLNDVKETQKQLAKAYLYVRDSL